MLPGSGKAYRTGAMKPNRFTANLTLQSDAVMIPLLSALLSFPIVVSAATAPAYEWVRTIGSADREFNPAIGLDCADNIYITGYSGRLAQFGGIAGPTTGIFLAKYNRSGQLTWVQNPTQDSGSYPFDVSVDSSGNAYVVGRFYQDLVFGTNRLTIGEGKEGPFVIRFDADGRYEWGIQGVGPSYFSKIVPDNSGGFAVCGYLGGTTQFDQFPLTLTGSSDSFVIRILRGQTIAWSLQTSGPQSSMRVISGMRMDRSGNVFITGGFEGVANIGPLQVTAVDGRRREAFAAKIASDGKPLWARSIGITNYTGGDAIAIDSLGSVYVAGTTSAGESSRIFLVKLDANGQVLQQTLSPMGSFNARGLTLDAQGNSYIAGQTNNAGNIDILLLKFDRNGKIVWTKPSGDVFEDDVRGISIDSFGNAIITGVFARVTKFDSTVYPSVNGTEDLFLAKRAADKPLEPIVVSVNGEIIESSPIEVSGAARIELTSGLPHGEIVFTLDGSDPANSPGRYRGPFTVDRDVVLRALTFCEGSASFSEIRPYIILVSPKLNLKTSTSGGGTIGVSPSGPHDKNSAVQVTATPAPGWQFLGWGRDLSGSQNPATVNLDRDKWVSAYFGTPLTTRILGTGSTSREPDLPLYSYGSRVRLTAVPQPGFYFAAWGNEISSVDNPVILTCTNGAPVVSALFLSLSPNQASLTLEAAGHGHVRSQPLANRFDGQNVTITATPNPGDQFLRWEGDATGTVNPLTLSMTVSKRIRAVFTARPRLGLEEVDASRKHLRLILDSNPGQRVRFESASGVSSAWKGIGAGTNEIGQYFFPVPVDSPRQFYRAVLDN
jgi:hypothetical protein